MRLLLVEDDPVMSTTLARALERRGLRDRADGVARDQAVPELTFGDPVMAPVVQAIERVARTNATVLLLGESGTGKEVAARTIHAHSARAGGPFLAVNVSAATLASDDFAAFVMAELARVGVDPARLHLEVTETSLLLVSDRIRVAMEELAAQGITWWVDDFGTGFSSISHLRDLPISGVKLDMSFTRALSQANTHATKLARGLAGLAAGLDLAIGEFEEVGRIVKEFASEAEDNIKDFAEDAGDNIKNFAEDAKHKGQEAFEDIKGRLDGAARNSLRVC